MRTTIQAYEAALTKIVAKGSSGNDWVHIVRDPDGHFEVVIGEPFHTVTEAEARAEIESAIRAIQTDYHNQYFALRREHFGAGLGFI